MRPALAVNVGHVGPRPPHRGGYERGQCGLSPSVGFFGGEEIGHVDKGGGDYCISACHDLLGWQGGFER